MKGGFTRANGTSARAELPDKVGMTAIRRNHAKEDPGGEHREVGYYDPLDGVVGRFGTVRVGGGIAVYSIRPNGPQLQCRPFQCSGIVVHICT